MLKYGQEITPGLASGALRLEMNFIASTLTSVNIRVLLAMIFPNYMRIFSSDAGHGGDSYMFILRDTIFAHMGIPYKWGGNNPIEGFDCSGFVQWILMSAGIDPPGDQTAQALFDYFDLKGSRAPANLMGSLAFYGKKTTKIVHVGIFVDNFRVAEAGGGGPSTKTRSDAEAAGACTRIVHRTRRSDEIAVIRPSYHGIGCI